MNCYGIDGSKGGWVIASISNNIVNLCFTETLLELNTTNSCRIFIDMPVKLPISLDQYPRVSDRLAKKILSRRHSTIFYAPLFHWLSLDFETINNVCEQHNSPKLSKQSFNLFSKIKELQTILKSTKSSNFIEYHPELVLLKWLKQPAISKHTKDGLQQRQDLILKKINKLNLNIKESIFTIKKEKYSLIDVLDALILVIYNYELYLAGKSDNFF